MVADPWALHQWLTGPEITRLVWIDDDLNPISLLQDDLDITAELANRPGPEATLIAPASYTGLTPEHISQIEQTLNRQEAP